MAGERADGPPKVVEGLQFHGGFSDCTGGFPATALAVTSDSLAEGPLRCSVRKPQHLITFRDQKWSLFVIANSEDGKWHLSWLDDPGTSCRESEVFQIDRELTREGAGSPAGAR